MWPLLASFSLLVHAAVAGKLYILPSSPSEPQHISFPQLIQVQAHLFGYAHRLPNPLATPGTTSAGTDSDSHPLNHPALQFSKSWPTDTPSSGLFILVSGFTDTDTDTDTDTHPDIMAISPTFTFNHSSLNAIAYLDDIATTMAATYTGDLVQVTSERGGEAFVAGVSRLLLLENKPMLAAPTDSSMGAKLKSLAANVYAHSRTSLFDTELAFLDVLFAETTASLENTFYIVSLSQLSNVLKSHGADSEEYSSAAERVRQLVQKISSAYIGNSPDDGIVQIMTIPTSAPSSNPRVASVIHQAVANTSYVCPENVEACQSLYNNCSDRGSCTPHALIPNHAPCYLCTCRSYPIDENGTEITTGRKPVVWAGHSCQYQDISFDFGIVFFMSCRRCRLPSTQMDKMPMNRVGPGEGARFEQG
ncbi:hypothetical protein SeLEV6574_g07272 [Synchytrium endobioticum]|uniref:Vacuolar sorting protein Vps3844 C-terminal domain-containing protein n=1 Tax=Synchytrium endobioticum TaxID=286115 RepID=A0A507CIE5_9FUNG|nr:hypothetical protein SeLEV6574_g07272 [Synchytrium endobioticum]